MLHRSDIIPGFTPTFLNKNPTLRRSLSLRGLERSRRFSWEKCGRETLEILESLAA